MKTREELIDEMAKAIHAAGEALDGTAYAFEVAVKRFVENSRKFDLETKRIVRKLYRVKKQQAFEIMTFVEKFMERIEQIAAEYGAEVEE